MADATYQPKFYRQQGGDRAVVASGGSLDVESGGELDIESGGALKLAGTAIAATAAEINNVADLSARIVTETSDTLAVTAALHDMKTIMLSNADSPLAETTVTLPEATGSGAIFRFVVGVVNTANYIIACEGDGVFIGMIRSRATGDSPDALYDWFTAATDDTITLDGTTTGGAAIGDWIEMQDIAADKWVVTGYTTSSGAEATPFSTAA